MKENIFCDGSGWTGISSAYCVIYKNKKYTKVFEKKYNAYEIEYLALIGGLELAQKGDTIFSDAKNVVREVNLEREPLYHYKELFEQARELMKEKNIKVKWVSRKNNLAGFELAKRLKKLRQYQNKVMHPEINPKIKKERRRKIYTGK